MSTLLSGASEKNCTFFEAEILYWEYNGDKGNTLSLGFSNINSNTRIGVHNITKSELQNMSDRLATLAAELK